MEFIIMLILLSLVTFLINLPMGMWRVRVAKFSWQWFLAIHLSIPLIFYLRTEANISYIYIPIVIVAALIGQLVGGKMLVKRGKKYKLKKESA